MQILVVCSANRCRSPMGAALLRAALLERGSDASVGSAGSGPPGQPATPETVAAMAEVGVDLAGHRSESVTPALCDRADLLIGMTRQHVMELVVLEPGAWPRTFSLVDLVRRAGQIGARRPGEASGEWVRRAHGGRQRSSVLSLPAADDVADPTGHPVAAVRRTRDQLAELMTELAHLLAGDPG